MKIFASSDLHVDNKKSIHFDVLPKLLESQLKNEKEDCVFAIVGDVAQNICLLHNYLAQFKHIPIPKFFTAGNHDIWVEAAGSNSILKYRLLLKEAADDAGFHYLDASPALVDKVGFVGNIGWYDYSFRRRYLPLPDDCRLIRVEEKKYIDWDELNIDDYKKKELFGEVGGQLYILARWNDKRFIRWDFTDEEFAEHCFQKIKQDFDEIRSKVDQIVFLSHHIHFQQCIQYKGTAKWDFNTAFYGTEKIGKYLLKEDKVVAVIFAHSHMPNQCKVKHIDTYNFPFDGTSITLKSIEI